MTYGKELAKRLVKLFEELQRMGVVTDQTDFTQKIGMKSAHFTEIKMGRTGTKYSSVKNVEQVFGVNRDWLINNEGSMFAAEHIEVQEEKSIYEKIPPDELRIQILEDRISKLIATNENLSETIRQNAETINYYTKQQQGGDQSKKEEYPKKKYG